MTIRFTPNPKRTVFVSLSLATVCTVVAATPRPARAWGSKGHRVVALVATEGLSERARQEVRALLDGQSMANVALWADDLRGWHKNWVNDRKEQPGSELIAAELPEGFQGLSNMAERDLAERYILAVSGNNPERGLDVTSNHHFVNLPLLASGIAPRYTTATVGKHPRNDVVQMIQRCVQVLQAPNPLPNEPLSKRQALRFLIHCVGDLHQPLHVACGYWRTGANNKARRATAANLGSARSDMGGNQIILPSRDKLHGFWDTPMVQAAGPGSTPAYVSTLVTKIDMPAPWLASGSVSSLVEAACNRSSDAALEAYAHVNFTGLRRKKGNLEGATLMGGTSQYTQDLSATVNDQLASAGKLLAQLLNRIWP